MFKRSFILPKADRAKRDVIMAAALQDLEGEASGLGANLVFDLFKGFKKSSLLAGPDFHDYDPFDHVLGFVR